MKVIESINCFTVLQMFLSQMFQFVVTVKNCLVTKPDYVNICLKRLKGIKMVKVFSHISDICINHFLCKKTTFCNCCGI